MSFSQKYAITYLWRSISSKNRPEGLDEADDALLGGLVGVSVIVVIPLTILVVREDLAAFLDAEPGIGAASSGLTPFFTALWSLPELLLNDEDILGGLLESFLTYWAVSRALLFDFLQNINKIWSAPQAA